VIVVTLLTIALIALAGSHLDRRTGLEVNNFWNPNTLVQTLTDASFFAIMAIGATMVIISGGIDLSVGSIYALAGVTMALVLRAMGRWAAARRRSSASPSASGSGCCAA
jgi:ribose transport system permease protein